MLTAYEVTVLMFPDQKSPVFQCTGSPDGKTRKEFEKGRKEDSKELKRAHRFLL
jgi:hypothetical protein